MTIESGFSVEDLKLKAPDLSFLIQLKFAVTPTVITPFLFMLVVLKGVSPSKVNRSASFISFVVTLMRCIVGAIRTVSYTHLRANET